MGIRCCICGSKDPDVDDGRCMDCISAGVAQRDAAYEPAEQGAGREDPKCPFCGTIGDHDCERQHALPEVSIQKERPLLLSEHMNKASEFFDAWTQGLLGQVSLVEALARLIAQIEHRLKAEPGAERKVQSRECEEGDHGDVGHVHTIAAEQAYHARAAGRTCHCGTPSEPHNESVHEEAWAEHILKMATRREPGADTGTTPPEGLSDDGIERLIEAGRLISLLSEESGKSCDGFRFREGVAEIRAALTVLGRAPYQRGAATQRAPVEQGREFDFEAIGDAIDRVLAGQRELTPAEQKNLRGIYSKLFTKLKPVPDHAREGALLREAKWWYKEFVWPWRADDEDSDDRARKRLAALADGKEGTLR